MRRSVKNDTPSADEIRDNLTTAEIETDNGCGNESKDSRFPEKSAVLTEIPIAGKLNHTPRRSGRAAECAGLENRLARKGHGGSNPSSSASDYIRLETSDRGELRLAASCDSASVANFTSCLLRNGPKLKRVVPPPAVVPIVS